jgi:endonuclease YncB( thermonuclease family)
LNEDGELARNAMRVVVQNVRDGDSISVSTTSEVNIPIFGDIAGTTPRHMQVRLLGVDTAEYAYEPDAASQARQRLIDALAAGARRGDTIYLVRDSEFAGTDVDPFDRMLAWLYIGDELYWEPDEIARGS